MNIEESIRELKGYLTWLEANGFSKLAKDSAIETLLTAYEKEKNKDMSCDLTETRADHIDESTMLKQIKLKLQEKNIPIETLLAEFERLEDLEDDREILKAELEKEKEKNKNAIDFINERKKTVNKDMAEGTRLQVGTFMWQVDELLEILKGVEEE